MSDCRNIHADQNRRLAQKMLEQQDEINALKAELAKREADVEFGDTKISELNRIMLRLQKRAAHGEVASAAIERVRRLQEMTIATSCRAGAIAQAEDTLAVLDAPETTEETDHA